MNKEKLEKSLDCYHKIQKIKTVKARMHEIICVEDIVRNFADEFSFQSESFLSDKTRINIAAEFEKAKILCMDEIDKILAEEEAKFDQL